MEKRVLLKDIAARVGVSIALVSYVLNNKKGRVGSAMAERIRNTAAEMNYRPNLVAKSLQSGRTNTIGLIVADISNAFFSRIARTIEQEAERLGYTVIFGSTDESAEKSGLLIGAFLNRQVDGLIIAPAAFTQDQLRALKRRKVPFVLIDRYFSNFNANSVRINNYDAAYQGCERLIATGRKRICLVNYQDTGMSHFTERTAGYLAAMKKHKCRANVVTVSYQQMEQEVSDAIKRMALQTDAYFFATHSLAIEGLKQMNEMKIDVPQQLAVLSFDENDAFDLFDPPVSFIRQPLPAIAHESVKLLLENIGSVSGRQTIVELDAELVIRKSCAPASGQPPKKSVKRLTKINQ